MIFLYNLIVLTASQLVKVAAMFSPKMKLFVEGRKEVTQKILAKINPSDRTIWFHTASLGEFEQGLPVMEAIKQKYPNHKIVVTFFSPSGYEVRKNNTVADVTVYLPLDTPAKVKSFLKAAHPDMVFFVKYEFWPNYLRQLKQQNIPTYLISGIFRENQVFFKWYGGFYRKALRTFEQFFVQNEKSKNLLQSIGFQNVKISGDTRFDRVSKILERDNSLDFIEDFIDGKMTLVAGSSWPKDESQYRDFVNDPSFDVKYIIAPHTIKPEQMQELKNSFTKKPVLFSEKEGKNLADYDIFIIDTIGLLTKIYSYADIAYVGGGFGTAGLHNILEPATFGIPIVIGPNYAKFSEAVALVGLGGCLSVKTKNELEETLALLIQNQDERLEKGHVCSTFVQMNKNATDIIMKNIQNV
ncbi:3-deoxy-D-manno-octulosonic acid transferase [Flavobacterium pallidum]|uniref:3-deoxy-D-manno-octulosonic acid transferase n=1 Tax=Flavobacterium pallidum TaxID=2172098 RepID=A0A2S1SED0_9FLAO|nr:glycosyltransferase N-terminal domain-containing protein [Flavobacterium pallidum]AWI24707.1 3-deoxy-D-manno-octulosonic acid transferase [Flavobacterium pallidum]